MRNKFRKVVFCLGWVDGDNNYDVQEIVYDISIVVLTLGTGIFIFTQL